MRYRFSLRSGLSVDEVFVFSLLQESAHAFLLVCRLKAASEELFLDDDGFVHADFQAFVDPLYKYINETESRVPISDWHDTITGRMTGFKARSVIGGYWMRVLMNKTLKAQ